MAISIEINPEKRTLADWRKHRKLTQAALHGKPRLMYDLLGYIPKAIYRRVENRKFRPPVKEAEIVETDLLNDE